MQMRRWAFIAGVGFALACMAGEALASDREEVGAKMQRADYTMSQSYEVEATIPAAPSSFFGDPNQASVIGMDIVGTPNSFPSTGVDQDGRHWQIATVGVGGRCL